MEYIYNAFVDNDDILLARKQKRTIKHYLNLLDRLHYPSTTIYAYEILLLQNVGILLLNLVVVNS